MMFVVWFKIGFCEALRRLIKYTYYLLKINNHPYFVDFNLLYMMLSFITASRVIA